MTDALNRSAELHSRPKLSWWAPVLLAGLAGGMGWGIRGQYGHETGAMIAGLLCSQVIVGLCCPNSSPLGAARAIAWGTIAIGFGGSMTYGQTVGLTHNVELIGNSDALRWGLFGLAVKGGTWIGFCGVFLGMGLGGQAYAARTLLLVMLCLGGLFFLGVWLINTPYRPEEQNLPAIYFSAHWHWEPGAELKPRREVWGGLLLALTGLVVWIGGVRRDRLACYLGLWGVLGGALGFPLGQCLQAGHAWHPEWFEFLGSIKPYINWWNLMETTFGATFGACLGWGAWLHRHRIAIPTSPPITLPVWSEVGLGGIHMTLLLLGEFASFLISDVYLEFSLLLGLIPIVAVAGGRWWPWLLVLPITVLPIAGKTVRQLVYNESAIDPIGGWLVYGAVPVGVAMLLSIWCIRQSEVKREGDGLIRTTLIVTTWLYFGLNFAFFRYPWPWSEWTGRTPHTLIFTVCAVGLTLGGWLFHPGRKDGANPRDTA